MASTFSAGTGSSSHPLGRAHVEAAVHVRRQVDALVQRPAHESDLLHHAVDFAVGGGPVHPVPARRVVRLVDVDLHGREAHALDFGDLLLGARLARVMGGRVAVDPNAVAHLPAQQLVHRQPDGFTRQVPQAALRSGEDAGGADLLPDRLDVQRIPTDEHPPPPGDDRPAADRGVGGLALPDQPLVGVDPDVQLRPVRPDEGRSHVRDLELRPPVRRHGRLNSRGKPRKAQRPGAHAKQRSASVVRHFG
jgi:hypothetical protein